MEIHRRVLGVGTTDIYNKMGSRSTEELNVLAADCERSLQYFHELCLCPYEIYMKHGCERNYDFETQIE